MKSQVNILIVDGNEKVSSEKYSELGMLTQYEVYQEVLEKVSAYELNISIVHPTWGDDFLPPGTNLDDFDGIAWTGSILNICLLYTSPSPRDKRQSRMPSSA